MPRPVMAKALALRGPRFVQYYGQTEAPLGISVPRKEDDVGDASAPRMLSAGRPSIDCEIRLLDDQGRDVAYGEPGEIALRAPFMMKGYHGQEGLTRETFTPDGWLKTRNVGRFDDEGYLYLVDRVSEMIVTGGFNVNPREVEDILCGHAAVRECAVIGLPDDKWGEAVTAFVVRRPEIPVEEGDLIAFVRARIAGYKVPKSVRFIDEVPKSPVGKLLRRALRDPFREGRERRL
jgi:fatty-acyl-CoA synthase